MTPELVMRRDVDGRGASAIEGWVPGETEAVIKWTGTDHTGMHEYTEVCASQREAMRLLESVGMYVNLELVSAELRAPSLDLESS